MILSGLGGMVALGAGGGDGWGIGEAAIAAMDGAGGVLQFS